MFDFPVDDCHDLFLETHRPELAFDENADFELWREKSLEKLIELLGDMPIPCDPDFQILWEKDMGDFKEIRFYFRSEERCGVPCHLLIPKSAPKPCPVMVCAQGHSSGMHISMGRAVYIGDNETLTNGDRDIAIQAVEMGYAALVIEQRGFGERKSERLTILTPDMHTTCQHPALVAILLGRTLIGERIWDVQRALDHLHNFTELDLDRIAIMGNSGGGTLSYYAACVEPRIKALMPSCSVCTYKHSITPRRHCACNYIPRIAKYFDMGDLAGLIAPKPMVVVAGEKDGGFRINGVKEAFETIKKVYEKAGCPDKCKLVVGDGGHRFFKDIGWEAFKSLTRW